MTFLPHTGEDRPVRYPIGGRARDKVTAHRERLERAEKRFLNNFVLVASRIVRFCSK
jgi:hypothetical protein